MPRALCGLVAAVHDRKPRLEAQLAIDEWAEPHRPDRPEVHLDQRQVTAPGERSQASDQDLSLLGVGQANTAVHPANELTSH